MNILSNRIKFHLKTFCTMRLQGADSTVYGFVYEDIQYFYVKNAQGDVLQIRSKWGTTLVEYEYDAWGNCTIAYTHSAYGSFGEINPIRYRSYFYDFETGFYYLQSRYYDPAIRRFISADDPGMIGASGTFLSYNLYAYCENNPISFIDISGNSKGFSFGHIYDLGNNWYARFDRGLVGNYDHVHIYNNYDDEWVMNLDGSMSHENRSNQGDPPKKILKKLKEKTKFDYTKVWKDFLNNDVAMMGGGMYSPAVFYTDGTILINGNYYYNMDYEDALRISKKADFKYVYFIPNLNFNFLMNFANWFDFSFSIPKLLPGY